MDEMVGVVHVKLHQGRGDLVMIMTMLKLPWREVAEVPRHRDLPQAKAKVWASRPSVGSVMGCAPGCSCSLATASLPACRPSPFEAPSFFISSAPVSRDSVSPDPQRPEVCLPCRVLAKLPWIIHVHDTIKVHQMVQELKLKNLDHFHYIKV